MAIEALNQNQNDNLAVVVGEESPPLTGGNVETTQGPNEVSFTSAVFNLSTAIIGTGMMALPATMKVLGLGIGIVTIVLFTFLTNFSIEMLLKFSRASGSVSYDGVMGDAFGNVGRFFLQVFVIISNIGVLIVFLITIGDVLSGSSSNGVHHAGVFEGWFGEHRWTGRLFVLIATLAVVALLAFLRHIDLLRFASTSAAVLTFVFLVIVVGITFAKLKNGSIARPRWLPVVTDINSVLKLFSVVPVLVMAYICHYNVHTIANQLEDPLRTRRVVRTSLALCLIFYITTSMLGFLLFGDSTLDDVLANFNTDLGIPFSSLLNDAVRVIYALHLMLVFPIVFYPLCLNDLLLICAGPLVADNHRPVLISIVLILLILLGANFITSIWVPFQFIEATAAVCLGLFFPAAIALRDRHGVATRNDRVLSGFIIGLAFMIGVGFLMCLAVSGNPVVIYSDAYALFKKKVSPLVLFH